jgi:hypothetical protein
MTGTLPMRSGVLARTRSFLSGLIGAGHGNSESVGRPPKTPVVDATTGKARLVSITECAHGVAQSALTNLLGAVSHAKGVECRQQLAGGQHGMFVALGSVVEKPPQILLDGIASGRRSDRPPWRSTWRDRSRLPSMPVQGVP